MPRDREIEFDVDEDEDDDSDSQDLAAQLAKARKDLARMGKENRDYAKQVREYEQFKAEREQESEQQTLAEAFEDVGLPGKLAGLFLATNPNVDLDELTEDEVFDWASNYGIEVVDEDGETYQPDAGDGDEGGADVEDDIMPIPTGGARTPRGALSRADWLKLADKDPLAAQAAYQAGRVDMSGLRDGLGPEK
jgi:hypothetical protein